jgi:hypothetical protein
MSTDMDSDGKQEVTDWYVERQQELEEAEAQAAQQIEEWDQFDDDSFIDDDYDPYDEPDATPITGSFFITPTHVEPAYERTYVYADSGVFSIEPRVLEQVQVGTLNFVYIHEGEITEVFGHG